MTDKKENPIPGHLSTQILNIACPRCGCGFATAAHEYYLEGRRFESIILCASDDCVYFKEATSTGTSGSSKAMKMVLNLYLEDG